MGALIDILKSIGEMITAVFAFIIDFFQDLLYVIQLTGKFLMAIPGYFSWLPGPLLTLLLVIFSIVVIYKILGREG